MKALEPSAEVIDRGAVAHRADLGDASKLGIAEVDCTTI